MPRNSQCLNGLWQFQAEGDTSWSEVRVPGAYSGVQKSWSGHYWDVFGYPDDWVERGGTYRQEFVVPSGMHGRRLAVRCEGCFHHTEVLVNGIKIGESHDGYLPFEFLVPAEILKPGGNELRFVVSSRRSDLFDDYKTYNRGIWQDVWLLGYGAVSVGEDIRLITSVRDGTLRCVVPLRNQSGADQTVRVRHQVLDAQANVVLDWDAGSHTVPANGGLEVESCREWANPRLWFPHDPCLHHLRTVLDGTDGAVLDEHRLRFGFREITWRGPHLYLNGQELFLRGHGGHSIGDIEGEHTYALAWLSELQKMGVNFMRLHDNPKHQSLYDAADELGFLLEAEPVFHFQVPREEAVWQAHLDHFVRRYRNRPSVIIWSVSNELRWHGGGEKKELIEFVKARDTTRPVFASDFSVESRHGDVVGHHYNPATVFEEWEAFGPDKPMVWDELGYDWEHDRPLMNGTAGYETAAQDYATGLWHDGWVQIRNDLAGMAAGRVFGGELHRVNAYCVWDLAYAFFRWLPFNNNRRLFLRHETLGGPGVKPAFVQPCAATVNPWDPTLPVMDPNPGYYLFERFLRAVRFEEELPATFFGGTELSLTSRLFYEDLRPADELRLIVEDAATDQPLWQATLPLSVRPGQVLESVRVGIRLPEVSAPTPVRLVREFRNQGVPGYRHVTPVKLFPAAAATVATATAGREIMTDLPTGHPVRRLLRAGGVMPREVAAASLPQTPPGVFVTADLKTARGADGLAFVERGGRIVCLADTEAAFELLGKVEETFAVEDGEQSAKTVLDLIDFKRPRATVGMAVLFDTGERPITLARSRLTWRSWAPDSDAPMKISARQESLGMSGSAYRLVFHKETGDGAYVAARFADSSSRPTAMAVGESAVMRADYDVAFIGGMLYNEMQPHNRTVRFLIRTADGEWLASDELFTIGNGKGELACRLTQVQWRLVGEDAVLGGELQLGAIMPAPTLVTGMGLLTAAVADHDVDFYLARLEIVNQAQASARLPLHGPPHRLLAGLDQRDFTFWRGGSAHSLLPPASGNQRTVLLGNKDGDGDALRVEPRGCGVCLLSTLRIGETLDSEPAAGTMLGNLLEYAFTYTPRKPVATAACGSARFLSFLRQTGLVFSEIPPSALPGLPADVGALVLDGADGPVQAMLAQPLVQREIANFLERGGQAVLMPVTDATVASLSTVTGLPLALTNPYLEERTHCVKAAVSWRRRDTPEDPVEYYDGVLIPQPFEPNLDPWLAGIANRDLQWNAPMFEHGVEVSGADPVNVGERHCVLVTNWRNDWGVPKLGGEYPHEFRDMKQAHWFVNRDPVLLRLKTGRGNMLLSQLSIQANPEKAAALWRKLFTALGAALETATGLPDDAAEFDLAPAADQRRRLAAHAGVIAPACRVWQGDVPCIRDMNKTGGTDKTPTVVVGFGDANFEACAKHISQTVNVEDLHLACIPHASSTLLRDDVRNHITKNRRAHILALGPEELKADADGRPVTGLAQFTENLEQILFWLRKCGAKIFATTLLPIPAGVPGYCRESLTAFNAELKRIADTHDVYTIDAHGFISERFPAWADGTDLALPPEAVAALSDQIASAIRFFGAQAVQ
jgi:hypothetical protein